MEVEDNYSNELTRNDTKAIQGMAILFMLALHLFCRRDDLPYTATLYIKDIPILYYLGLWGDQCVALFCFCAGYAAYLQQEQHEKKTYISYSIKRVTKLLLNYWIVVLLFSLIGLLVGKSDSIPGSFLNFLGNFFLLSNSYNGAWWFLLIYVLLVALSPLLYRIIKKQNGVIVLGGISIIYFFSYLIRFGILVVPDMGVIFNWLIRQSVLLGTAVLPYVFGMLFYKKTIVSKIRKLGGCFPNFTIIVLTIIAFGVCIVTHGIEESLILAPIYAVITVCVVSLWKGKVIILLKNIGEHSTNIWLIHMFYYLVLFDGFIFVFRYPILIYIMMFGLCMGSSFIVKLILERIVSHIKVLN